MFFEKIGGVAMAKHYLCERAKDHTTDLHIYVNSDKFTKEQQTLVASFNNDDVAYSIDLTKGNVEETLDWFMGFIGRDTQNWFRYDVVIHWGVHEWKFYNARNISTFDKDTIKFFDKGDYDYED